MVVEGIDVSAFQGHINWWQVRHAGKRFAAIKATEGLDYQDPWFPRNWDRSKYRGITRVAYHFLHPGELGAEQADYLHAYVHTHGRFTAGDGVMLDMEVLDGRPTERILGAATAFVARILDTTPCGVFLYTYPDFWLNQLGNPTDTILAKCPLWLADYGARVPHIDNWSGGLSVWQYSASGHVPGIVGDCDLDRYFGDMVSLDKLCRQGGRG